jgi:hypothetical protein
MFLCYLIGLALYVMLSVYWIRCSKSPILRRFAWGSCGGAFTGLQNFLKDSLTIHKATPHDGSYPWCFFLFVLLAAASAFIGLLMLTACMKRYDATYSAASFVGSFVGKKQQPRLLILYVHTNAFVNRRSHYYCRSPPFEKSECIHYECRSLQHLRAVGNCLELYPISCWFVGSNAWSIHFGERISGSGRGR